MLARIVCFLRGYVEVLVESHFIERFINICIRRDIYLWDIRYKDSHSATMKMSIHSFFRIRPIAKKTSSKLHILHKNGAPIFFHRHKKRYFLFGGFLTTICFLIVMSQFVWSIDVIGNEKVESERILSVLSELGFKRGVYKRRFDARDLKNNALLHLDELGWIWVDIKGSRAFVYVNEKTDAPPILDKNKPCDIVASKAGVIKDLTVKEGQSSVSIGQTVMEGELLISGVIKSERAEPRFTHAVGEVLARTWYEESGVYPLSRQIREPTGRKKKRISLHIMGAEINFFTDKKSVYEEYDSEEKQHDLVIFGWYTGLSLKIQTLCEVNVSYEPINAQQVMENVRSELEARIASKIGAGAVFCASDLRYKEVDENNIMVTLTAEYTEPIGLEKEIDTIFEPPAEEKE